MARGAERFRIRKEIDCCCRARWFQANSSNAVKPVRPAQVTEIGRLPSDLHPLLELRQHLETLVLDDTVVFNPDASNFREIKPGFDG